LLSSIYFVKRGSALQPTLVSTLKSL